ncbi:MAG: hypothetical protein WEB09_05430 [Nitriliruptor sp.]
MLATVGAVVWTVRALVGRLGQLGGDLDRLQRELTPALRELEAGSEVTSTELAAVSDRLEARRRVSSARSRRRWRPRRG